MIYQCFRHSKLLLDISCSRVFGHIWLLIIDGVLLMLECSIQLGVSYIFTVEHFVEYWIGTLKN